MSIHKMVCKGGDRIHIDLPPDLDPRTPVGLLFARGPLEIRMNRIHDDRAKITISAHARFRILHQKDKL